MSAGGIVHGVRCPGGICPGENVLTLAPGAPFPSIGYCDVRMRCHQCTPFERLSFGLSKSICRETGIWTYPPSQNDQTDIPPIPYLLEDLGPRTCPAVDDWKSFTATPLGSTDIGYDFSRRTDSLMGCRWANIDDGLLVLSAVHYVGQYRVSTACCQPRVTDGTRHEP